MRAGATCLGIFFSVAALTQLACERKPSSVLQGQQNTTLTFFGLTVDQDGTPLPGVVVEYNVEAYRTDWTFETRDKPNDVSQITVTSDDRGKFQFIVTGCFLRRLKVEKKGYRHFDGDDADGKPSGVGVGTRAYGLISWGEITFKSDPDNPAVYVLVKNGKHAISALPCTGGYEPWFNGTWRKNLPGWPKYPSLGDVDRKGDPPRVNASLPMYVWVVDQDGQSLAGVQVDVWVDRWLSVSELTYQPHRPRNEQKRRQGKSGADGGVIVDVEAFAITGISAEKQGYAQFKKPVTGEGAPDSYSCRLIDWGKQIYRSDKSLPTVVVMVKEGAKNIQVLPSRGGEQLIDGKWSPSQPLTPRKP